MRCRSLVPAFLFFSVGFVGTTHGQTPSSNATRDPQAVLLLTQCAAMMGASAIQDTYAQGSIVSTATPDSTGTIVSYSKGLNVRNDVTDSTGLVTLVVNSGKAWSIRSGTKTSLAYQTGAYYRPEFVPALGCVIDLNRPYMSVAYVGVEEVAGRSTYHVRFNATLANDQDNTEKLISEYHLFLDQQTLVVLKARTFVFSPDTVSNYSTWETYYSDYRKVSGVLMPFHITNYLAGQKVEDITFTTIQVNVGVPDSEFN